MTRALASLLSFLLCACASQTRLPDHVRKGISAKHAGTTVELRQSCYFGDLYDENEKWLLSPAPFADTFHIVDTDGTPIRPRGQRGIIPAGSAFVIQQVEFPDSRAMATRMLTTPRYNPWVYLTPAPGNDKAPRERRSFILLLPLDLDTEAAVESQIARFLAPAGEVTQWLSQLRPTVRVAVEHKDVLAGMTLTELVASQGDPVRWFNDSDDKGPARIAWYPSREHWLRQDVVVESKPARPVAEDRPPRGEAPARQQPTRNAAGPS